MTARASWSPWSRTAHASGRQGKGDKVVILTNQTPFYGESGGQIGDTGTISSDKGLQADVEDTSKPLGKLHAHHAVIRKGKVAVGDAVHLVVDAARRAKVRANHSATHLLHAALRHRLGDHVTQKGSLVAPDYFRFDFSQQQGADPRGYRGGRGRGEPPHPRE